MPGTVVRFVAELVEDPASAPLGPPRYSGIPAGTEPLISHSSPAERADEAFRLLHEQPAESVQVVLDFGA